LENLGHAPKKKRKKKKKKKEKEKKKCPPIVNINPAIQGSTSKWM
jgi:hypothetical protein